MGMSACISTGTEQISCHPLLKQVTSITVPQVLCVMMSAEQGKLHHLVEDHAPAVVGGAARARRP